jgi:hypothetical protein
MNRRKVAERVRESTVRTGAARISLGVLASLLAHVSAVHADIAQEDPLAALKLDGQRLGVSNSAEALCSPAALKTHYNGSLEDAVAERSGTVDGAIRRNEFAMSSAQARNAAAEFSYCYAHYGAASEAPRYASAVGHFLVLGISAAHQAQMANAQTTADEDRARVLLRYASANGGDAAADLKTLDAFGPKKDPTTAGHDFRMTARALVTEYQANELAFRAKYGGKSLQVTGRARALSALPDGRAMVAIVGIERDPGHGRLKDELTCEIKDPAGLSKAAQWKIPATVTVVGTYEAPTDFVSGVFLKDCRPAGP